MKTYFYMILVLLSDGLVFMKNYVPDGNSFDMLRMIYIEKTMYAGAGFSPFLIFVMMGFTFNMILSVSYITSNHISSGSSFVLSRFDSCGRCLLYLFADTLKRIVLCAFVLSFIPAFISVLLCGGECLPDTVKLAGIFFLRQLLMLCFGALAALIIGKKLISATADILGTLLILLLAAADIFSEFSIVLADVSANNFFCAGIEFMILISAIVIYFVCFGKSRDKLDERQ